MIADSLTDVDIKIIDSIMEQYKLPKKNLDYKQVMLLFHEYKKVRFSGDAPVKKSGQRKFTAFVQYCLDRNLANFDTLILITAGKGMGKSSTAIQLARAWCKLIGIRFDPKRHIAYNNEDMIRLIKELKPFEPIIADEAIRFATAEDWNKAENKELKKTLGQVRTKHLFYILCFPLKPSKLDKTYLNSYVDYWIDLYDRGKGHVFIKDMNPSGDVWNLKRFEKMGNWNEFTSPKLIEKIIKKHPNFWTKFIVPKVPKNVYAKYLDVRETNVYDEKTTLDAMSKEDFHRSALILTLRDLIARDGTISINRVIKSIERTYKVQMTKQQLKMIMDDAEQMIKKVSERGDVQR